MNDKTNRADYACRIKENPKEGNWCLMLEPRGKELSILVDGILCLEFWKDVDRSTASKLASLLSECVDVISYTKIAEDDIFRAFTVNE